MEARRFASVQGLAIYDLPRLWLGVLITAQIGAAVAFLSAVALARQSMGVPAPKRD